MAVNPSIEQVAVPVTLNATFPAPPESVANKTWFVNFAVLVRNLVAIAVVVGVVPATVSNDAIALILGIVGIGALALSEGAVLWRSIAEVNQTQRSQEAARVEQMKFAAFLQAPQTQAIYQAMRVDVAQRNEQAR